MLRSLSLSIARKYLEPGESLAEVLFGLIMTLTFTLGAGLLVEQGEPAAVQELLIATVGCNIAWGIIDGMLYISGQIFERARMARLGQLIRSADTEAAAAAVVREEMEEIIGITVDETEREDLFRRMARHVRASKPRPRGVTRADLYGALASFWLVFFASIPAALPFLFIDDAKVALRTSNAILVCLLFVAGYRWAHHTALRPWRAGLVFMTVGFALVAMAVALGG